ncbi:MAG: hypothetical protein AAF577_11660 [Pseudomonadota bacterium]
MSIPFEIKLLFGFVLALGFLSGELFPDFKGLASFTNIGFLSTAAFTLFLFFLVMAPKAALTWQFAAAAGIFGLISFYWETLPNNATAFAENARSAQQLRSIIDSPSFKFEPDPEQRAIRELWAYCQARANTNTFWIQNLLDGLGQTNPLSQLGPISGTLLSKYPSVDFDCR